LGSINRRITVKAGLRQKCKDSISKITNAKRMGGRGNGLSGRVPA
jgi:hypothetical protein